MEIILTPFLLLAGAVIGSALIYLFIISLMGIIAAPLYGVDFIINKAKRHSDTP